MVDKMDPDFVLHPADIELIRKPNWSCLTFMGKEQDVGVLLRKLASALDDLGDVFVGDVIIARELGLDGYEFRATLYFQPAADPPESGQE